MDAQVGPLQVDIKDIVPQRLLESQHRPIPDNPCVANEEVDVSVFLQHTLRRDGDTRRIRYIHAGKATQGQRGCNGSSGFLIARPDPRRASLTAEPFYNRSSDSSGTACDDGDSAFEFAHSFASS